MTKINAAKKFRTTLTRDKKLQEELIKPPSISELH
jgi:hypothetical protein